MPEDIESFLQSFGELGALLISQETVSSTLGRIGELAVMGIDGCDSASVSLMEEDHVSSVVFTSALAEEGDRDQYSTGQGPCLTAINERRSVVVEALENDPRWPDFRVLALDRGVGSMLSMPLVIDHSVGALNLYSRSAHGFGERDQSLASLFAAQAAVALANAQVHERDVALASQLQDALISRAVIDQAKGILMEREHCTAEEAFAILRSVSQATNRKLRDVAQDLVDTASTMRGPS